MMETTTVNKEITIPDGTDLNELFNDVNEIGIGADQLIMADFKETPCLLEPFLPCEGIGVIAGESDIGKSTFLRQLSMAIVSGEPDFLGFKLNTKYNRVIYVSSEDSRYALSKYCKSYSGHFGKDSGSFKEMRFVQDSEDILKHLEKTLKLKCCDLVVMDVLTDFYFGKLNESTSVRAFLRDYFNLSARYGCLILFCHHTGKASQKGEPSKHNLLGSQAIEAKSRITLELMGDPQGNEDKRHLFITKGNYLSPAEKEDGYELLFRNLIFEPTGKRTPKFLYTAEGAEDRLKLEAEIRSLKDQGKSQAEIGKQVNKSQGQVSRILKRIDESTPYTPYEDIAPF